MSDPTRRDRRSASGGLRLLTASASAFLLLFLGLPLLALVWRALQAGGQVLPAFQGLAIVRAITISLITTAVSVVLMLLLGTPLAYAFARFRFPLRNALTVLIEMPVVMPPVVAGLALLLAFGRRGLLGAPLSALGVQLPFTPLAIIMAQVFVASPFYVRAAQVQFLSVPRELEEAAEIDGAGGLRTFLDVILPLSWRGMLAGILLSWSRALGEFGATILFAGNLPGRTQTMPLLVYSALEQDLEAAIWTGLILILTAGLSIVAIQALAGSRGLEDESRPPGRSYTT